MRVRAGEKGRGDGRGMGADAAPTKIMVLVWEEIKSSTWPRMFGMLR